MRDMRRKRFGSDMKNFVKQNNGFIRITMLLEELNGLYRCSS